MSDDQTRPTEPDAPVPPPGPGAPQPSAQPSAEAPAQTSQQSTQQPTQQPPPAYAMPLPAGYPAYAAPQRPRFADQVLGMRAVVAVAIACLVIGGLSGWILGHAAAGDDGRWGRGPGSFWRGPVPDGQTGRPGGPDGFPFGQGSGR